MIALIECCLQGFLRGEGLDAGSVLYREPPSKDKYSKWSSKSAD